MSVTHEKTAVMDSLNAFIAFWTLGSPRALPQIYMVAPGFILYVGFSSEASMCIKGSLLLLLIFFTFIAQMNRP